MWNVTCKTKVAKLKVFVGINKKVLRLDVSVDHILLVAVVNGLKQLEDILLDQIGLQARLPFFNDLQKCLINEFEN